MANSRSLAIYGGRFNPPGLHHRRIAEAVLGHFNHLYIAPCGLYGHKVNDVTVNNSILKQMIQLGFEGLPEVEFDFSDLDFSRFTTIYDQQVYYQILHPNAEIWHVIGGDLVAGGQADNSAIQKTWYRGQEVWEKLKFAVVAHPKCPVKTENLPPHSMLIQLPMLFGRSEIIRKRIAAGLPIDELVVEPVARLIESQRLYRQ